MGGITAAWFPAGQEKAAQDSWAQEQMEVGPWDWAPGVTVNSSLSKQHLDPPPSDAECKGSCPQPRPLPAPPNLTVCLPSEKNYATLLSPP